MDRRATDAQWCGTCAVCKCKARESLSTLRPGGHGSPHDRCRSSVSVVASNARVWLEDGSKRPPSRKTAPDSTRRMSRSAPLLRPTPRSCYSRTCCSSLSWGLNTCTLVHSGWRCWTSGAVRGAWAGVTQVRLMRSARSRSGSFARPSGVTAPLGHYRAQTTAAQKDGSQTCADACKRRP
jgi:hypothetical protein